MGQVNTAYDGAQHTDELWLFLTNTVTTVALWVAPLPLSPQNQTWSWIVVGLSWLFNIFLSIGSRQICIRDAGNTKQLEMNTQSQSQRIAYCCTHFDGHFIVCYFQQCTRIDSQYKLIYYIEPTCVSPSPELHWLHTFWSAFYCCWAGYTYDCVDHR